LPADFEFPQSRPEVVRERLSNPDLSAFVAEDDDGLAGLVGCGVSRDPDASKGVGEIHTLFVAAGRWRGGIGRALMAAALADLRERADAEATVWSFAANDRANAFYESEGFTRDGAERTEETWAHIPEVRYRRALP
jgi:GNAT superfamily N-acetyltransferase